MSAPSVGAACVLLAVLVLLRNPAGAHRRLTGRVRSGAGEVQRARRPPVGGSLLTNRGVAATAATVAAVVLSGPALGTLVGLALVAVLWWVVPGLESREVRARRSALDRQAADVVDLLVACLASGATVHSSIQVVAGAVDDPAAGLLAAVARAAQLGADPAVAWRSIESDPAAGALRPVAGAVARSEQTGAPLAGLLPRVADDLRAARHADLLERARRVGVRMTGPLGLAFLPAFVLLGVVPVVAALVGSLVARL